MQYSCNIDIQRAVFAFCKKESDSMVSSQVLQKTLDELKSITKVDLSVLNIDGTVLVSTMVEEQVDHATVRQFVDSPADSQILQ